MTGKIILKIFGCFSFGIMIIITLFWYSRGISKGENGFIRLFPPHMIDGRKEMDLTYNSFYLAGATAKHLYLANATYPKSIWITDHALLDTQRINLHIADSGKIAWKAVRVVVDSPNIFCLEPITPAILKGDLADFTFYRLATNNFNFSLSVPLSVSTFVNLVYDGAKDETKLVKVPADARIGDARSYMIEKQKEGLFSTDGMIRFDRLSNRLVYIYYYRNQFICLDSNLNFRYQSRTIDTISQAKINVVRIASENKIVLAAPPLLVNNLSCIDQDILYINSPRLANNENEKGFASYSVIDMYSLKDGSYKYSFNIPDYKGQKLRNFSVINHRIVAFQGHFMLTYKLNR
ncbi:MAG TPA: hypothetical protein VK543_14030 [Puia sp.]|nr:hypothetical protein [Puia sp.]